MVDAAPFRALRYDPDVVGDVRRASAPAVDDIDRFDYARHRTASPYTVLELLSPREGLGYQASAAALARWRRTGVLVQDRVRAFYAYEQRVPPSPGHAGHVQRGVLAAVRGEQQAILPHEDVDPERVAARVERLLAVPVDLAPVYTIAAGLPHTASTLLETAVRREPLVAITDEGGTEHRIVACTDRDEIALLRAALAQVPVLIADGHHRYAAATALDRDRILMLIVDASRTQPLVLPVHRLLRTLPADWPQRLAPDFEPVPVPFASPPVDPGPAVPLRLPGALVLLRPRDIAALRARLPADKPPAWRALDTALVDGILLPLLGVEAGTVGYSAEQDAAAEVDQGLADGLILVHPVPLATVWALAAADQRLPTKSTSFRPKPRTGLIMRQHDGS